MKVIIPLAGKGTRLRPHTHLKPKPLLQVAGQPVIKYVLEQLKDYGNIDEIIFITGHHKEQIEQYIHNEFPEFKARFVEQKEQKGTGHAVGLAKPYIDEDVLIVFVDTLFEADLTEIDRLPEDASGILWAKHVDEHEHFGVIVHDNNRFMTKIVEKPEEPISKLANIGLYYIRDYKMLFEGIDTILQKPPGHGGEYVLTDAFQYMVDHGAKLKVAEVQEWYDCGQLQTIIDTNKYLLEKGRARHPEVSAGVKITQPVFIADDVEMSNVEIGPNVTISHGCVLRNSKISNSIIGERTVVESASLNNSLIGNDVVIRDVEGSLNVADHSEIVGTQV